MAFMSNMKKIIIAVAALTIAISVITANNLSSVMLIMASRQGNAQVQSGNTVTQDNASQNTNTNTNNVTPNNNTTPTAAPSGNTATTAAPSGNTATTAAPSGDNKQDAPAANGDWTTEKIVDYYKNAVNKAKSSAKTVTRVKDGAINYNGIVEAGKLSGAASTLMGMFMVGSEAEIEEKNEAFTNNDIPPAGTNSNLTVTGVKDAKIEENGSNYIITIVAKDAKSPKAGDDGVGSLVSVIEEQTITGSISAVPGLTLSNINIDYENVKVVATVDKATGNLINISVDAPCILSLGAKIPIIGSIDNAKVGIEVISEFAMTY